MVTGIGIVSPIGDSPLSLHASLCEGISAFRKIELFSTDGFECCQAGEISSFSPETYLGKGNFRPLDRTSQLIISAAELALGDSGWTEELRNAHEVGLIVGTMFCSVHTISEFDRQGVMLGQRFASPMDFANTVINAAAGQTAIWHRLRGINSTVAGGVTAGLQAINYASDLIRSSQANTLLVGGVEELCYETLLGFDKSGLLCGTDSGDGAFPVPFDKRRKGFALSEGASLLMLEEEESARDRGAKILAEIKGYGYAYDLKRLKHNQDLIEAISRSIQDAAKESGLRMDEIDCLSASANGSIHGDRCEAKGIHLAFQERASSLPVTAIKSTLGETLGASGPFQVVDLIQSMTNGILPGISKLKEADGEIPLNNIKSGVRKLNITHGMVNSVGIDGNCCSLVVAKYRE